MTSGKLRRSQVCARDILAPHRVIAPSANNENHAPGGPISRNDEAFPNVVTMKDKTCVCTSSLQHESFDSICVEDVVLEGLA